MTELEKIKTELTAILDGYKQSLISGNDNKPDKFILSENDILTTREQRAIDIQNKMEYVKYSHIIKYGDQNESEIDKLIKTYVQSFVEYQNSIGL